MMQDDWIHVCYAMHDGGGFAKYVGTSMASLLANTKARVALHLLHDATLTEEDRAKFSALVSRYGARARIAFYLLEQLAAERIAYLTREIAGMAESRFGPAALYRLLAADVLPKDISRIIYLDADTVVNLDIAALYAERTGENGFAVCREDVVTRGLPAPQYLRTAGLVAGGKYFNSGVLLIDLAAYRHCVHDVLAGGVQLLRECPECFCYDQDILNFFFAEGAADLPLRYNDFVVSARRVGEREIKPHIYHYAGKALDVMATEDAYNRLFVHCFAQTPWYDAAFLMRLTEHLRTAYESRKKTLARMTDLAAGRMRQLYGSAAMEPAVRDAFALRAGESYRIVVDAAGELVVGRLIAAMKEKRDGLHIFFFDGYDALAPHLVRAGFEKEKDFFDGRIFLPAGSGGWQLSGTDLFDGL